MDGDGLLMSNEEIQWTLLEASNLADEMGEQALASDLHRLHQWLFALRVEVRGLRDERDRLRAQVGADA